MADKDVLFPEPPTPELVRDAQSGSNEAFELLVVRFQRSIQRFLVIHTHEVELAADLTQVAFVTAFEHLGQLKDPAAFEAWLYQIARRSWHMHLRRRRHHAQISLTQLAEGVRIPQALTRRQPEIDRVGERLLVQQAFISMRPSLREALWLRHIASFSDPEIAEALGISPAAAQKRAHRAEALFRTQYTKLSTSVGLEAADREREVSEQTVTTSRSKT